MLAIDDPAYFDTHCYACRAPITQPACGRRRQYCSNACRQRWYRRVRPLTDDARYAQEARLAERALRQWERRFGPFDDAPDPEFGISFRWRLLYRLRRDMPIPFCRWCGRPYIPDGGPGLTTRCCSDRCRRRLRDFRDALDTGLHRFDPVLDRRIFVRLRLNDPETLPDAPPLPAVTGLCAHCGMPFPRYVRDHKYCSKRCRQAASWRRHHGRTLGRDRCRECHRRYPVKQPTQRYCSRRCQRRHCDQKYYAPRAKTTLRDACVVCGDSLPSPAATGGPRRQTCSTRCRSTAHRRRDKQRRERAIS